MILKDPYVAECNYFSNDITWKYKLEIFDYQIKHVLLTCQPQRGKEVKASCGSRNFSLDAESYTYTTIK